MEIGWENCRTASIHPSTGLAFAQINNLVFSNVSVKIIGRKIYKQPLIHCPRLKAIKATCHQILKMAPILILNPTPQAK